MCFVDREYKRFISNFALKAEPENIVFLGPLKKPRSKTAVKKYERTIMNMRREVSMNLRKKFRLFTNFEVRTFGTESQKQP